MNAIVRRENARVKTHLVGIDAKTVQKDIMETNVKKEIACGEVGHLGESRFFTWY